MCWFTKELFLYYYHLDYWWVATANSCCIFHHIFAVSNDWTNHSTVRLGTRHLWPAKTQRNTGNTEDIMIITARDEKGSIITHNNATSMALIKCQIIGISKHKSFIKLMNLGYNENGLSNAGIWSKSSFVIQQWTKSFAIDLWSTNNCAPEV